MMKTNMKKYRVHFKVHEVSKRYVEVEATTEAEARSLSQDILSEGDPCGWKEYSYNSDESFQRTEEV